METPYVSGWYEKSGGQLYVNRGIGTTILPIRLGARPEITILGKRGLRILVQIPHVGVRRCAVEVEVVLLDVLAVIPLIAGQPKQALLQVGSRSFQTDRAKQSKSPL